MTAIAQQITASINKLTDSMLPCVIHAAVHAKLAIYQHTIAAYQRYTRFNQRYL
jgi:hypothetical protein